MRITALLPLALAIVAFVLSMLCLFAGHKPGVLEDYHIITVRKPEPTRTTTLSDIYLLPSSTPLHLVMT